MRIFIKSSVLLIALLVFAGLPVARAETVVLIHPTDLRGWTAVNTGGASGQFVAGPGTPPAGGGAFHQVLSGPSSDKQELLSGALNGLALTTLASDFSYWTYVKTNVAGSATTMSIYVDLNGNGTWDGYPTDDRLNFEPQYQTGSEAMVAGESSVPNQCPGIPRCVAKETWQRWDAGAGGWWSKNDGVTGPPMRTLQGYAAIHPGAKLVTDSQAFKLDAGSGWGAFDGSADAVHANGVLYDFNSDSSTPTQLTSISPGSTQNSSVSTLSGSAGQGVVSVSVLDNAAGPGNTPAGFHEIARAAVTNTAWSVTVSFANGAHSLIVEGLGAAKNVLTTSDPISFTIADTTAPASPTITTPVDATALSGNSVVVRGTAELFATVRVFVDGALAAVTDADRTGAFSVETALGAGRHTITAVALDAAGNASAASRATSVVIDQTSPAPPTVRAPDALVAPHFMISGTVEPGASVRIDEGSVRHGVIFADAAGAWSLALHLPDGAHDLVLHAVDTAGNVSTTATTISVVVDAITPKVETAQSGTQIISPLDTITVNGTASDDRGLGSVTVRYVNNLTGATVRTDRATCACGATSSAWSDSPPLGPGPYTVLVTAMDRVGNVSDQATLGLLVL